MFMSARNDARRALRANLSAGLAILLASCAVGPDFVRPAPPADSHYIFGGDPKATADKSAGIQRFSAGADVEAQWWHMFNSTRLDAVIAEAIARNPGLEAAQSSLRAAEDDLKSGYGVFYPQVASGFGASRQTSSPIKLGETGPSSLYNLYSLSGTISYTLDIFGGERRMVESLGAEKDVAFANEKAAYVTLTANAADAVIARAAARAEIDATKELIALETEQVALAKVQARAGTVPYSNALGIESVLESTEASIPALELKAQQADDLLSTLAGHAPAEWQAPAVSLSDLTLPGDLPVSVPSVLVRQRPDILAAEATAHAASANIGVATAAMLPNITLSGSGSYNANRMSNLFAAGGGIWSLGADIAQPLFEGGTLWYKRKEAIETYRQTSALYRQTVLGAFGQVADTLGALDHDSEALRADDRALATAREALKLVQANYKSGLATYLDVINADVQFHNAEIARIQAVSARYQDTVALFMALGGGWWNEAQKTAAQ